MDPIPEPTDEELIEAGQMLWRQGNASFTEAVMMLRAKREVVEQGPAGDGES